MSVASDPSGLIVSSTGPHGANGVCQVIKQEKVVEQEKAESAPAAQAACLRAVKKTTSNSRVKVVETIASEANNQVIVGVGPQAARWRCLVKRGKVADVMSLTDEGAR